jgi:MFS family permease
MNTKEQSLEFERRWAMIAAVAAVAGVALVLASFGSSASGVRATAGLAERLQEIDGERGMLILASIAQALGWMLLAVPLVYLFKAASARAPQVRRGLIGVVIVAPLFLGIGSLLSASSVLDAATKVNDIAPAQIESCVADKRQEAEDDPDSEVADLTPDEITQECQDDEARDLRTGAPLSSLETGFGLAGLIGFTIAVVYCALWGMRTGLLSRFWGSLGLALGAVFVFFTLFTLVWFIYLGLLFAGWVPGGRPPAWASGQAMPWPSGGGLFGNRDPGPGSDSQDGPGDGVLEGYGEPVEDIADAGADGESPSGDSPHIERRKRKKRSG